MKPTLNTQRMSVWTFAVLAAVSLGACRTPEKSEIEVEVRSIGLDQASGAPVVLLQDRTGTLALPIWIGPTEAQAIATQIQGIAPPRPMTHDLMKTMLDRVGAQFQRIAIYELKDSTYYARIYLHAGGKDLQFDCRPSDAIALAVRFHSPMFVATALMKGENAVELPREAAATATLKLAGLTVQNLTGELAAYFSLPPGTGVLVSDVTSDAAASLQRGDIILEIDGAAVTGVEDFGTKIRALKGSTAQLSVQRGSERLQVSFAPVMGS
jgi:bifunctional DNase/RNase